MYFREILCKYKILQLESIAYAAVDLLNQVWNGQAQIKENFAATHPVFQESCGCKAKHPRKRSQYVTDSIFREVRAIELHNELMGQKHMLRMFTQRR